MTAPGLHTQRGQFEVCPFKLINPTLSSDKRSMKWESGSLKTLAIIAFLALNAGILATEPAAVARLDAVPGSRYTSGQGAAMGDAVLPLGEDAASGLAYNPANLGKLHGLQAELLNFQGYLGNDLVHQMGASIYKFATLPSYATTLKKNPNSLHSAGASLFPNVSIGHLAFGLMIGEQIATKYDSASDKFVTKANYQLIPTAGYGVKLARGIVRLGYSFQYVNRAAGTTAVASSAPVGYSSGLPQGSALSHNFGGALTIPFTYLPSFNFVLRNIGGARYSGNSLYSFSKNASGVPATEPMTVDLSLGVSPKLGSGATVNFVAEMRDATNRSKVSLWGRTALGMEWNYRKALFFRAGLGSAYPSAGLGLRSKSSELSLGWYSEEIGTSSLDERDTRFIVHYQIGIF